MVFYHSCSPKRDGPVTGSEWQKEEKYKENYAILLLLDDTVTRVKTDYKMEKWRHKLKLKNRLKYTETCMKE